MRVSFLCMATISRCLIVRFFVFFLFLVVRFYKLLSLKNEIMPYRCLSKFSFFIYNKTAVNGANHYPGFHISPQKKSMNNYDATINLLITTLTISGGGGSPYDSSYNEQWLFSCMNHSI